MATYNSAHAALPALASGTPDSPAPAIAAGDPLAVGDMSAASRQVKRRKVLHGASPRPCTDQELEDAVKREFCVHSEHATNAAATPAWAAALVNNVQNQLRNMQNQFSNSSTYEPNHPIFPVRNDDGNLPPNFPTTRLGLDNLPANQLAKLLQFYGIPKTPVATRLERLKLHLCIRP